MAGPHTLPDDALVSVTDGLGKRETMTLGEVCARWKDARHFAIEWALTTKGEWRSLGLTVRLLKVKLGKWTVEYAPPPIPVRDCDWHFTHEDYDASYEGEEDGWVDNGLGGHGASVEDCKAQIAEIEEDKGMALTEAA